VKIKKKVGQEGLPKVRWGTIDCKEAMWGRKVLGAWDPGGAPKKTRSETSKG